jgi:hypothetical protein
MKEPFETLFERNNWSPFEYEGKTISIGDTFQIPKGRVKFIVRFEQVNSNWEQGVFFKGQGPFTVNMDVMQTGFYLWHSTSPTVVECEVYSQTGEFKVWNMWRINGGPMQYGHNGAAMYFEEIPNGKRYFCNDGYPDDDFDDLIFSIEIID